VRYYLLILLILSVSQIFVYVIQDIDKDRIEVFAIFTEKAKELFWIFYFDLLVVEQKGFDAFD
jgi:hypothetical protein